jgi:AhpD family alkylhydroperoxidase
MGKYQQIAEELRQPVKDLRALIPEQWSSFADMHRHGFKKGVIDEKTKELIALAIAIVKRCDGCISAHAKGAARKGATAQEVAEAIGVALILDGATVTVYGPRAYEAFMEFKNAEADHG